MTGVGIIVRCQASGRVLVQFDASALCIFFKFPTMDVSDLSIERLQKLASLLCKRTGIKQTGERMQANMYYNSTLFWLIVHKDEVALRPSYYWMSPWSFLGSGADVGYFSRMLMMNTMFRLVRSAMTNQRAIDLSTDLSTDTRATRAITGEIKDTRATIKVSTEIGATKATTEEMRTTRPTTEEMRTNRPTTEEMRATRITTEEIGEIGETRATTLKGANIYQLTYASSRKQDVYNVQIPLSNIRKAGFILRCRRTGKVLVVYGKHSRMWSFPKGALEATDTSPFAGAERELREETGINLSALVDSGEITVDKENVIISYGSTVYFQGTYDSTMAVFKRLQPLDRREVKRAASLPLSVFCTRGRYKKQIANRDVITYAHRKSERKNKMIF